MPRSESNEAGQRGSEADDSSRNESVETQDVKSETKESPPPRCCSRLRDDFRLPFFGLKDVNGEIIDVQASFAPRPKLRTLLSKVCVFGWSVSSLGQGVAESDNQSFFMAYLTNWSLVMAIMYLLSSLVLSLLKEPEQPNENDRPNVLVRFTWALFSIGAVAELTATLLFWTLVFEKDNGVEYVTVMAHGGVMVLILLEGFLLNRIPVRAKHLLFPIVFNVVYLIWSIIHSATDIGNPNNNDGDKDGDDDAIYSSLNWSERPGSAAVVVAVCLILVVPLLFFAVWYLSIMSGPCRFDGSNRRYYGNSTAISGDDPKALVDEEQPSG